MHEEILVVEDKSVKDLLVYEPGLIKINHSLVLQLISEHGFFKPRDTVEHDPTYKQIIPYIAMYNDSDEILTLKRLETQSEKRLHNKLSVGVGGHVNRQDSESPLQAFKKGMEREIAEEVNVLIKDEPEFLGLIYDQTTDVGQVHLGLAYKVKVDFYGINEKDKFEYSWKTQKDLKKQRYLMENWSIFILDEI